MLNLFWLNNSPNNKFDREFSVLFEGTRLVLLHGKSAQTHKKGELREGIRQKVVCF